MQEDWKGELRSKDAEAWNSDGGQRRQTQNGITAGVIVLEMLESLFAF